MKKVVVICGPTASGKSKLAHLLAKKNNGEIINADSMQLYRDILILTSSPSRKEKKELPYHLYNFLDIDCNFSALKYAQVAADKVKQVNLREKLPILVGGSGMYISFLINGFSYIPDVDPEIRKAVRILQNSLSYSDFFSLLQKADPLAATFLNPTDLQRVSRAYEVFLQNGRSIIDYQKIKTELLGDFAFQIILLLPERQKLYSMCNSRLEIMFQSGAVEEVQSIIRKKHDLATTLVTKVIGMKEITSYLQGKLSREEALESARLRTRQYAKRQITWFRNQIAAKKNVILLKSFMLK